MEQVWGVAGVGWSWCRVGWSWCRVGRHLDGAITAADEETRVALILSQRRHLTVTRSRIERLHFLTGVNHPYDHRAALAYAHHLSITTHLSITASLAHPHHLSITTHLSITASLAHAHHLSITIHLSITSFLPHVHQLSITTHMSNMWNIHRSININVL